MRRINPQIADLLARHGESIIDFARKAGVDRSTIFALINPEQHPHRIGGMHRTTAWKLARAYAQLTGLDADAAYAVIIVEDSADRAD